MSDAIVSGNDEANVVDDVAEAVHFQLNVGLDVFRDSLVDSVPSLSDYDNERI